jgi:hypothetical protein
MGDRKPKTGNRRQETGVMGKREEAWGRIAASARRLHLSPFPGLLSPEADGRSSARLNTKNSATIAYVRQTRFFFWGEEADPGGAPAHVCREAPLPFARGCFGRCGNPRVGAAAQGLPLSALRILASHVVVGPGEVRRRACENAARCGITFACACTRDVGFLN